MGLHQMFPTFIGGRAVLPTSVTSLQGSWERGSSAVCFRISRLLLCPWRKAEIRVGGKHPEWKRQSHLRPVTIKYAYPCFSACPGIFSSPYELGCPYVPKQSFSKTSLLTRQDSPFSLSSLTVCFI